MKRIFNDCLQEYCSRDYYPWHMPGHKRQVVASTEMEAVKEVNESEERTEKTGNSVIDGLGIQMDVTELPGLDNLLAPEGVLSESMAQLAEIYGSRKSYYLVNGSTCGILTTVSAVCDSGDTIIMSRNCHKAVYNIVALLNLKPVYLYPRTIEPYGICGSITPAQVERALHENPEAKAVIFPSPTYEGILSDVRGISEVVHRAGRRLIVDEAHGAHLEFGAGFPDSAVRCGADLVIESLHKTLPCYTQCAILHIGRTKTGSMESENKKTEGAKPGGKKTGNEETREETENQMNDRELIERVERYLGVYQTSSPSYLFVAAMENCIAEMEEGRQTRMAEYYSRLKYYRKKWMGLKWIHLLTTEEVRRAGCFAYDESKLIFCMPEHTWSGEEFRKELEKGFGMVLEMASVNYALAMTSVADCEAGYKRLHLALQEMDRRASQCRLSKKTEGFAGNHPHKSKIERKAERAARMHSEQKAVLPGEALRKKSKHIPLAEAVGQIAGDYVTVYPPGIPVLVPGELITEVQRDYIEECVQWGLTVHGIAQDSFGQGEEQYYIKILMEHENAL
ncbi:MAG: aminotransferase class I/II-fold pyridoxal phosphate-dependent enzyme [Bacteroides sp.]|nr:aminotransferase class I/II-fold pyridoxal phosphate-dependent enzyme [Bacteroides sp.]MCM1550646.1 aminotransferase class I/II-fold pyridoxal phosphate-dependent enzyme [Clostridium sp.]